MAYTEQTWANDSGGGTPLSADRLNHIEDGIGAAAVAGDLGNAATKNTGTTAGTVAAGDDSRFGGGGGTPGTAVVVYSGSLTTARPSAVFVVWEGFPSQPTNFADGDLWLSPDASGVPAGGTSGQVLAKNSGTDYDTGWTTPTGGSGSSLLVANTRTASYTAVLGDGGGLVEMNVASANTFTAPHNSTVAFPIGTLIEVCQLGAGATTIAVPVGVTLRSAGSKVAISGQYVTVGLRKRATNEWVLVGSLA